MSILKKNPAVKVLRFLKNILTILKICQQIAQKGLLYT